VSGISIVVQASVLMAVKKENSYSTCKRKRIMVTLGNACVLAGYLNASVSSTV
jgi:hypothetical protein